MIIGPTPPKGEVFGGLGPRWHKRTFLDMPSFGGAVYPLRPLLSTPGALTKTPVPMGPQTCWKSCATLPWRSWTFSIAFKFHQLRGRSCGVPAGPIWEKQISHGASFCKLRCDVWPVRWDAVFCFSRCLRPLSRVFVWQHLTALKDQKCEIDSCKWSDLQKSLARGAATLPSFYRLSREMAYLRRPRTSHIVIFSRLPIPPQVCHLCRISITT